MPQRVCIDRSTGGTVASPTRQLRCWPGALVLGIGLVSSTSACAASPPEHRPGEPPPIGTGRFASVGRCSVDACPAEPCGSHAVGAPDGRTVDLGSCRTLDLVFAGGVIATVAGQPDLAIHVQGPAETGETRIEASEDGVDYALVGFIGLAPAGVPARCRASDAGQLILVDMTPCTRISNVSFVRLRCESGRVLVDAIEALSFKAR